jgi:NADH-quinone oxidoreductase subunit M
MLVSILAIYFHSAPHTFDLTELLKQVSPMTRVFGLVVYTGFFLGFAVKIPAFPFHTWLPLAHVEAPTAVSVILAGVLLKMGSYGLMRFGFPLFPAAAQETSVLLAVIASINIIYGAFCSLAQTDIKRMIAYSSVNHMGYVLLGMAALNPVGFNGALLQMVAHGVVTGSLFLLVGVLYDRAHTRDIGAFGGLGAVVPQYTGFMMLACFASLGLPLLAGFVSEFSCFLGAFQVKALRGIALVSLSGVLLTAVFFLVMIRRVFLGPLNEKWKALPDLNARERLTLIPLAILTVVLGVHPALILRPAGETLTHLAELAKQVIR